MIPNRIFLIWLGKSMPLSAGIAALSAVHVQKPEEMFFYVEKDLCKGDGFELVKNDARISFKQIDEDNIFSDLNDNGICLELYKTLKSPASKTNLLRLALLYKYGGVYLDTDTITVKPWNELLKYKGFCGLEPLAFPHELFESVNPLRYLLAGLRYVWRFLCIYFPHGEQIFRKTERFYNMAANNAVLASEAGNKLLEKAFAKINEMDKKEQLKRFRLGTYLLQKITENKSSEYMEVLPSAYFYPVGPDVSVHLFRKNSAKRIDRILQPQTLVVHWYNSVEKLFLHQQIDKKWIEEHSTSAFAKLSQIVTIFKT